MSYLIDQSGLFQAERKTSDNKMSDKALEKELQKNKEVEVQNRPELEQLKRLGLSGAALMESDQCTSYHFLHQSQKDDCSFVQVIDCDRKIRNWRNNIRFLRNHNAYIKVASRERTLLLYKELIKKSSQKNFSLIKVCIDPRNGIVKMVLSEYIFTNSISFNPITMIKRFLYQAQHLIEEYTDFMKKINDSASFCSHNYQTLKKNDGDIIRGQKMRSHHKKFGIHLSYSFNEDPINNQSRALARERESINKLLHYQKTITKDEFRPLTLFIPQEDAGDQIVYQGDLQLNPIDRDDIKGRTKMPGVSKCKNPLDNNSILNFIKINNFDKAGFRQINQGGFTKIYMTEIQFWYVSSGALTDPRSYTQDGSFSRDNLLKKMVVIKRDESSTGRSLRNRISHEKQILKLIKNGQAIFIPKYYIPVDKTYQNDLFSDCLFNPTLMEYIMSRREFISMNSKIYILFMIIQAMRYLKMYNIVHLDLKPNNILVSKSMMVKVIDFGESYHPSFCDKNHSPGSTMPYSAPQTYASNCAFNEKNDIFSFGVMAYEILFNKFPFFIYKESERSKVFRENTYTNRWFYCFEEMTNYGDQDIFPLLQLMINRCLDPDPSKRPELDWMCIILREAIDYYY